MPKAHTAQKLNNFPDPEDFFNFLDPTSLLGMLDYSGLLKHVDRLTLLRFLDDEEFNESMFLQGLEDYQGIENPIKTVVKSIIDTTNTISSYVEHYCQKTGIVTQMLFFIHYYPSKSDLTRFIVADDLLKRCLRDYKEKGGEFNPDEFTASVQEALDVSLGKKKSLAGRIRVKREPVIAIKACNEVVTLKMKECKDAFKKLERYEVELMARDNIILTKDGVIDNVVEERDEFKEKMDNALEERDEFKEKMDNALEERDAFEDKMDNALEERNEFEDEKNELAALLMKSDPQAYAEFKNHRKASIKPPTVRPTDLYFTPVQMGDQELLGVVQNNNQMENLAEASGSSLRHRRP